MWWTIFLLLLSSSLSFFSGSNSLTMMFLDVASDTFLHAVHWSPWVCKVSIYVGIFLSLLAPNILPAPFSTFGRKKKIFWNSHYAYVSILEGVPQFTEAFLLLLFFIFCFCFLDWIISIDLSSSLLICFLPA